MKAQHLFSLALSVWTLLPSVSAHAETEPKMLFNDPLVIKAPDSPDALYGSYHQPLWSVERAFTETRSYVIPQNAIDAEFWLVVKAEPEGAGNKILLKQEIEYGFAPHLQFDLYVNQIQSPDTLGEFQLEGAQIELRWALADWGNLWSNPTFYFEYHPRHNASDQAEIRLLLADTILPKWRWSVNLGFETELSGDVTHEFALTGALARSLLKNDLSLGIEAKAEWLDIKEARGDFSKEYYLGPSLQWKPAPKTHIDFTTLIGLNPKSNATETFIVFGYEL